MTPTKKAVIDFGERVGATFLQAFIGVALATGVSDVRAVEAAGVAGAVAAAMFVKVRLNSYLGEENSNGT